MKVCPSQHSGRNLEHHHTSYGALGLLLLVTGFALGASTLSANAATESELNSMQVTAYVSGALPGAPTILAPSPNQNFISNPITVSGDCTPGLNVEIRKNNFIAGSARCLPNGSYSLKIDLLVGTNKLTAKQFNGLGGSPEFGPVLVTYRPVLPAPGPQTQLVLLPDISSLASGIGEEITWKIHVLGGEGPYAMSWDWGDGSADLKSIESPGDYMFRHIYRQPGSHKVSVSATDKNGQTALIELSQYTSGEPVATGSTGEHGGLLLVLWPLYALLIALLWTFYIGERYGEIQERKHPHLRH